MTKKFVCFILLLCFGISFVSYSSFAAGGELLTNEEFFGAWDERSENWSAQYPGKLQYKENNPWEAIGAENWSQTEKSLWIEAECFAKCGDYANASAKLHEYYNIRTNNSFHPAYTITTVKNSKSNVDMYNDNFLWNNTSMLDTKTFTCTPAKISFDVSKNVKTNGSYSFIMLARTTDGPLVYVNSKESGSNVPVLVVTSGEKEYRFNVKKDTYIKPNINKNENFSSENTLLISEGKSCGASLFSDSTARTYLQFDITGISSFTSARIDVYGSSESEDQSVCIWTGNNTVWQENTFNWSNAIIEIVNFSGCPDGVNWQLMKNDTQSGLSNSFASWMGRGYWMTTIAKYASYSKSATYANSAVNQIKDFIYDAEFADSSRIGVGYTDSLSTAIRAREFVTVFYFMLPYISDSDCVLFLKYIWHLTEYLSRAENFRANHNWGTFQLYGYLRSSTVITEFRQSKAWFDNGIERFGEMIDTLFDSSDGSYKEGSSHYGIEAIKNLFIVKNELSGFGVELTATQKEKLRKGVEYQVNLLYPNGVDSAYGDSAFESPDFTSEIAYLGDEQMKYIVTNGKSGTKPDYTSVIYPDGGNKFVVMRDGWSEDSLALYTNNGAGNGLSHTHPDNLALTAYGYGERLLVDVGNYTYDNNEISNFMRYTTKAHNTVTINSIAQSTKKTDPISIWRTNDAFDFFSASTSATDGFNHTRNIYFMKNGFWIVSDSIVPESGEINTYEQNWHMLPSAVPSIDNVTKSGQSNNVGKANISVIQANKKNVTAELNDGYTMAEGTLKNEKYLSFTKKESGIITFDTLLYPQPAGGLDFVTANNLDTEFDDSEASVSEITVNSKKMLYYVSHNEAVKACKFSDYEFSGKAALLDMSSGVKSADIINATLLKQNGRTLFFSDKPVSDMRIMWKSDGIELTSSSVDNVNSAGIMIAYDGETANVTLNGKKLLCRKSGDMIILNGVNEREELIRENFEGISEGTYTGHDNFKTYITSDGKTWGSFSIQKEDDNKRLCFVRGNKLPGRNSYINVDFPATEYNFLSFDMEFISVPVRNDKQIEYITLWKSGASQQNIAQLSIVDGEFSYPDENGETVSLSDKIKFVSGKKYYLRIIADKECGVYSLYLQPDPICENSKPVAAGIPLRDKTASVEFDAARYTCRIDASAENSGGETIYIDNIEITGASKHTVGRINGDIALKKANGIAEAKVYMTSNRDEGSLILAQYDGNMNLKKISSVQIDKYHRGGQILLVSEQCENQDNVKAFLWESFSSLLPITEKIANN